MNDTTILKVSQKLEIFKSEQQAQKVFAWIEKITPDAITLFLPSDELLPIKTGEEINAQWILDNCAGIGILKSVVLHKKNRCLILSISNIKEIQRRNFTRVDTQIEIEYRKLEELTQISSADFQKAITKNISGGGLMLLVEDNPNLQIGEILELILHLPKQEKVEAVSKINRIECDSNESPQKKVAVEFAIIAEKDRATIVKLVFEEKTKQRYKELTGG